MSEIFDAYDKEEKGYLNEDQFGQLLNENIKNGIKKEEITSILNRFETN